MNLLFAKDEAQIDHIKASGFFSDPQYILFPLMPKAALSLLDLGIPDVRLPITFLSKPERQAIHAQAIELSKSWYRPLGGKLEYEGIDLLDCCRLQVIGFFQDILAAEQIIPRLIAEYKPKNALFLKNPSIPSFDSHMHDGTSDVFEAVLLWRLQQRGVNVISPSVSILTKVGKNLRRSFLALRKNFGKALNPFKESVHLRKQREEDPRRIKLSDLPKTKPLLVGFGSGYDLLIIWPYLKALAAEIDGFPVLINSAPNFDPTTLRSGLTLDEAFRYLYAGDIPLAPAAGLTPKVIRNSCIEASKNRETLHNSLQNPLLDFQFKLLWNSLVPAAMRAARQATSFYANYNPILYLDDYCAGADNRAWTEAGNRANVVTVNVSHGGINLLEFFDFNSQWMLTRGELDRRQLASAFPDKKGQIGIIGDPVMENIGSSFTGAHPLKRDTVLIMTGGFLHQVWTDMDLEGFISTWEEIAQIAHERPTLKFIVKPHPSVRDMGDWYRAFVRKKSVPSLTVIDNQKLEDLLPSAFFAILLGKPGTAGLVAALAGVPFVYLDTMLCRDVPGYRIWCDDNGVPKLRNASQLGEMIDQTHSNIQFREELLNQNRRFLKLYLQTFEPASVIQQLNLEKLTR